MASRRAAAPRGDGAGAGEERPQPAPSGDAEAAKRRRAETIERVSAKLQAAVWVTIAGLLLTYGGVGDAALNPAKTNPLFMAAGAAASAVVFAVFCYLVIYLRYVARVDLDWGVYAPRAIPVATGAGVVAFLRRVSRTMARKLRAWLDRARRRGVGSLGAEPSASPAVVGDGEQRLRARDVRVRCPH